MLHLLLWNLILVKKKEHIIELYSLILKVVIEHDEDKINELKQYLAERWDHFIQLFNLSFTCFILKYS